MEMLVYWKFTFCVPLAAEPLCPCSMFCRSCWTEANAFCAPERSPDCSACPSVLKSWAKELALEVVDALPVPELVPEAVDVLSVVDCVKELSRLLI